MTLVKVKLFAYLSEQISTEIELGLPARFDRAAFLQIFSEKYPTVVIETLSVAVNQAFIFDGEFVSSDEVTEIAVIPPVSGG